MKAQLNRERLEEKLLEHIKHGGDSEEETMIRMLLAVMDSKPVATLDIQSGRPDGNKFALTYSSAAHKLPDDVYYLHTAPPAPVAVPDEATPQSMREMFCQLYDSKCVFDANAWNTRRAAMQAEPVSAAYRLPPHVYRELVNQLRDTAVKYQGCQQLREQIGVTLRSVIAPAAPDQEA